ncbi:hypothetical protein SteCoe_15381 [Stentor coeruleus]|uniref:Uncharacterized protein n=1 Tax=Stentor coeruleus TaxID=5963 RepID=A0A1R2C3P8_9CILI|nr:hypothetical protein SteCoe_15381 [Stentor coeruleus]
MKRRRTILEYMPVKSLRPNGSVCRYHPECIGNPISNFQALCSIMVAAQEGILYILKYHVENTKKDYYKESYGPFRRNLLHLTAFSNNIECIKYVLENKLANLFSKDEQNKFPVDLARDEGKILIQKEMNWQRRKAFIFMYSFSKKELPVSIIRILVCDYL